MQFPITIGLRRSSLLDRILMSVSTLIVGVVIVTPWPIAIKVAICLTASVLTCLTWRQLRPQLAVIRLERDGKIKVIRAGSLEFEPVDCLPGATVHPWLTVLALKGERGGRLSLIAAVDSLDHQDFRRLRIFLRWRAIFSGQDAAV